MLPVQPIKEIVTVAEMARNVNLSRARFYQLVREGVFPEPSRNPATGRPFYNREQQERCLQVRRTNRGVNGQGILFYARRLETTAKPRQVPGRTKKPQRQDRAGGVRSDPVIDHLRQGLQQLGMDEISPAALQAALAEAYPDGHQQVDQAELLLTVFRRLKRQDSHDNLA